jgi:beta-lactamase class D
MSGGLTTAWLESSLSISADEQLRFWKRLWRGDLPVSRHAIAMTKTITFVDRSPAGWTLHGKTGSGAVDSAGAGPGEIGPGDKAARARSRKPDLGIGWFVGHVSRGEREYVFVTSSTDRAEPADRRPAGWIARDLTKTILEELGLR